MDTDEFKQLLNERISSLPTPVRRAIESSAVEKHLRSLAGKYKLHFDQWDALEQEVMLTLVGVHPIEDLELNIVAEIDVSLNIAHSLANDINIVIFEPIREELERQLAHPEAQDKEVSEMETARTEAIAAAEEPSPTSTPPLPEAPAVTPATPPAPKPEVTVTRPSDSTAYRPGEASSARKEIADDPYREPLI